MRRAAAGRSPTDGSLGAAGEFGFVLGLLGLKAGVRGALPFRSSRAGVGLCAPGLAALDLAGIVRPSCRWRRVGLVGLGKQLGDDFLIEGVQGFLGVAVTHG